MMIPKKCSASYANVLMLTKLIIFIKVDLTKKEELIQP